MSTARLVTRKQALRRARRALRESNTNNQPLQISVALDSSYLTEPCSCPICAHVARLGLPHVVVNERGELVDVPPPLVTEQIDVLVEPGNAVAPYVGGRVLRETVPRGCKAWDFVEYLRWVYAELRGGFRIGELVLEHDGQRVGDGDELCDEQRLRLVRR